MFSKCDQNLERKELRGVARGDPVGSPNSCSRRRTSHTSYNHDGALLERPQKSIVKYSKLEKWKMVPICLKLIMFYNVLEQCFCNKHIEYLGLLCCVVIIVAKSLEILCVFFNNLGFNCFCYLFIFRWVYDTFQC